MGPVGDFLDFCFTFFTTPLEHTPKPLPTGCKPGFLSLANGGLPGVCSRGVL